MSYSFHTFNNNADLTFNQLLSINNSGTIAGYFGIGQTATATNADPNKGYTLAPPHTQVSYTLENFPFSSQTQVTGINSFGLTVGFWVNNNTAFTNSGFVDNGGTFTSVVDPNAPTVAGAVNQLLGVNDLDQAAGFYVDGKQNSHGYIYNIATGTFTPVTVKGATSVTATDINNEGVISGFDVTGTVTDGFIDNNGSITTLTGPAGATSTQALGLNNEGQVVGDYTDSVGNMHGFVYNVATGAYTTIDDPNATPSTPGAATMTVVNGINDLGQLVGFYLDANGNTDGMLADIPGTIATIANPTEDSTIRMPAGYGGVILQGTHDVTLTDGGNGKGLLEGNSGNDAIVAAGSSDTVLAGSGNSTVFAGTNELVVGSAGGLLFVGGAGSVSGGANTVVGGSGSETAFDGGTSGLFLVGSGPFVLVNQGGSDTVLAGAGSSSVVALGGSGGTVNLLSSANGNVLAAGGGNETLNAAGTTGTATFWAGGGNDQLVGGSGHDVFIFANGVAHGSDTVGGWTGKDKLVLTGYGSGAIVNQANVGGNALITLKDGTTISFTGVHHIPSSHISLI